MTPREVSWSIDQLDKSHLLGGEAAVVQELREGRLGGRIHTTGEGL